MSSREDEEIKAWLGFNKRDILGTIGVILVILAFFVSDKPLLLLISVGALFFFYESLWLYFHKKNTKISELSESLNKWISVGAFALCVLVLAIRVLFVFS